MNEMGKRRKAEEYNLKKRVGVGPRGPLLYEKLANDSKRKPKKKKEKKKETEILKNDGEEEGDQKTPLDFELS